MLVSLVLGLLLVLLSLVPPLLELLSLEVLSVEVLAPVDVDAGTSLGREFWLPAWSRMHWVFSAPVIDSQSDDGVDPYELVLLPFVLSLALCAKAPPENARTVARAMNCDFMQVSLGWTSSLGRARPIPLPQAFAPLTGNQP